MAPGLDLSLLAHELDHADHSSLSQKAFKPTSATPSKGTVVLDPSNVTTEFDLLRFEAAAFGQLHVNGIDNGNRNVQSYHHLQTSSLLISSPYNNPGHYLDLTTLDTPDLLFSKALTALKPLRPDYATAPYTEALDFSAVLEAVRHFAKDEQFAWKEHTFYVVVFRSKLKDSIPNDLLYQLDYESHREACESGGLLKYWFGKPDEERRNLATCFWRSREDARLGGLGPWHNKARAAGRELYEFINFSTHRFTILDGAIDFTFETWDE